MLIKGQKYAQSIELFNQLVAQGFKHAELYNVVSEAYLNTGKFTGLRRTAHRNGTRSHVGR